MTFIIAECGVGWRNLAEADQMIKEAAEAGADACKFQAYDVEQAQQAGISEHLERIRLMPVDIRYLYYRCQQHGIEFMCTPMYPEAVEMLDPYVKRWKVRFKDRINPKILLAVDATRKEVLRSRECTDALGRNPDSNWKNLYCIPDYPPKDYPKQRDFEGFDGYSCHIPSWEHAAFVAMSQPLDYLEVHVRLDTYDPAWEPPDQRVSITMSELRKLCKELGK